MERQKIPANWPKKNPKSRIDAPLQTVSLIEGFAPFSVEADGKSLDVLCLTFFSVQVSVTL